MKTQTPELCLSSSRSLLLHMMLKLLVPVGLSGTSCSMNEAHATLQDHCKKWPCSPPHSSILFLKIVLTPSLHRHWVFFSLVTYIFLYAFFTDVKLLNLIFNCDKQTILKRISSEQWMPNVGIVWEIDQASTFRKVWIWSEP